MRREGRVRGKPTNKSRLPGRRRCRFGRHRCRDHCPHHSGEKSWEKRNHRCKRFAGDVCTNPALADFRLQPRRTRLRGRLEDRDDERSWCSSVETDEGAVQTRIILDATVNSIIEAAFANFHVGGYGDDDFEMDENAALACTTDELGGGAPPLAGDIAAIELAFQRQLGIFENAVEGSSFSEYATQGWSTVSEESWSDVELAESDEENSPQDDWSMVDVNGDES